jgi:GNAT superfamily N-acetyltransferase
MSEVVPITEVTASQYKEFSCGQEPLDEYLKRYAKGNHRRGIGKTFVIVLEQKVAGFYTLSMGTVEFCSVPKNHQSSGSFQKFSKEFGPDFSVQLPGSPNTASAFGVECAETRRQLASSCRARAQSWAGKDGLNSQKFLKWSTSLPKYPIPVGRIGRLAVDACQKGRGLGKFLLASAIHKIWDASQVVAAYGVVVDAKNSEAIAFYQYCGFTPFENQPRSLFLPLSSFHEIL